MDHENLAGEVKCYDWSKLQTIHRILTISQSVRILIRFLTSISQGSERTTRWCLVKHGLWAFIYNMVSWKLECMFKRVLMNETRKASCEYHLGKDSLQALRKILSPFLGFVILVVQSQVKRQTDSGQILWNRMIRSVITKKIHFGTGDLREGKQVRALTEVILSCPWTRHFTLTLSLSIQVHKKGTGELNTGG